MCPHSPQVTEYEYEYIRSVVLARVLTPNYTMLSIHPGDVLLPLLVTSSQPCSTNSTISSVVLAMPQAKLCPDPVSRNTAWPPECMQSKFYVTKSVQQVERHNPSQKTNTKPKQTQIQILKLKLKQEQLHLQLQQMGSHV